MYFVSENGVEARYNPKWEKIFHKPQQKLIDYNYEQVAKGIDVELEHTDNPEIALFITLHHLDEIPDYYSRLLLMEEEADGYWSKE